MSRGRRMDRAGRLVVIAIVLAPFVALWAAMVRGSREPMTFRLGLDMAIWTGVFATPWVIAAWLLWRAWWRRAGVRLSTLDGPALLLAAAAATLPQDRRDWGAAMAAELAQVQGGSARWRFAAGCARTAIFPPRGSRTPVLVAGGLAAVTLAATALATGAAAPAMRVLGLTFVALVGGLATLAAARSRRLRRGGPGPAVAATGLVGVAACGAFTVHYLTEYPAYHRVHPPALRVSLPPVTAVVLGVVLAGCLWLALRPPRWLLPDRHGRRFGIAMAVALVAGFVWTSRLEVRDAPGSAGMMEYLLNGPILVVLTGSAAAAAAGRSFRSGLWACAWALALGAPLLIAAWLAEALRWHQQGRGLLLDDAGGFGVGANLGNAVWWPLVFLLLWALPLGVIGAAAGSALTRRRRSLAATSTPSS